MMTSLSLSIPATVHQTHASRSRKEEEEEEEEVVLLGQGQSLDNSSPGSPGTDDGCSVDTGVAVCGVVVDVLSELPAEEKERKMKVDQAQQWRGKKVEEEEQEEEQEEEEEEEEEEEQEEEEEEEQEEEEEGTDCGSATEDNEEEQEEATTHAHIPHLSSTLTTDLPSIPVRHQTGELSFPEPHRMDKQHTVDLTQRFTTLSVHNESERKNSQFKGDRGRGWIKEVEKEGVVVMPVEETDSAVMVTTDEVEEEEEEEEDNVEFKAGRTYRKLCKQLLDARVLTATPPHVVVLYI